MAEEEIDEGIIVTGVDKLMSMLYEKKRVQLTEASKQLGVSPSVMEYWAYVLEGQGLIKITYTLTSVYLEWMGSGG